MSLKIFHTADIQVNIGGRHFNRKIEYETMLAEMSEIVVSQNYNLVVIAGDLFERYNANETEKTVLITKFIQPILDANIQIVMIDGNHDLKQSNFSFDPGDGSVEDEVNVVKAIHAHINNPLLSYFEETGFYNIVVNDMKVVFAVWSQKSKFSSVDMPYNPWFKLSQQPASKQESIKAALQDSIVIDLFHDSVKTCQNFDGGVVRFNYAY